MGLGTYGAIRSARHYRAENFNQYPKPIADSLRRAIYYGDYNHNQDLALKYYKKALEQCDELRLDYFSDEVIAVKIRFAQWLEKIDNHVNAVLVLETVMTDCKRWMTAMEAKVQNGAGEKPVEAKPVDAKTADATPSADGEDEAKTLQHLWAKRNRILSKAIAISVKLGELYSDDHVLKPELAHESLTWAVENLLKELHRRTVEGVKDGEGEWFTSEAIGGSLEGMSPPPDERQKRAAEFV